LVERGTKRWITSSGELARLGIESADILVVPAEFLSAIPSGAPIGGHLDSRTRLSAQYLIGDGIEIGAAQSPIWVGEEVRVRYVDLLSPAEYHARHPQLERAALVDVDVIDDGEKLAQFEDASLHFIVANHFLEHTENPLGTIRVHLSKLRENGVLLYAIPDKRFTFDVDRPLTTFDHLVRDDRDGPETSRRDHYVEFTRLVDKLGPGEAERHAETLMDIDNRIHFHVWDFESLQDFFTQAREYLGSAYDLERLEQGGNEVIAVLRKSTVATGEKPKAQAGH
jgi:predicted SAM-dependent methyltransferase